MSPRAETPAWVSLPDAELLQLRFCDLGLKLAGTRLAEKLNRVHGELERRELRFRPHMWLSEEWFSPDGVPGIAIPFYLAHPRLMKLERQMMREVEGGNANWMMRILRHEVGHAIDTAFRLRQRARWREVFGPASLPYPETYRARPGSRSFVRHLGEWYAQSHPTEDFAETFAVWLKPNSDWRRTYASWPAWEKLRLVDEMMREIAGRSPPVRNRAFVEPVSGNRRTLSQHYREKIARQMDWRSEAIDGMLLRVFAKRPAHARVMRAATFLRANRRELLVSGAAEDGIDNYNLHHALRIAIEGSDNMQLYLRGAPRNAMPHARWLLARLVRLLDERERPHLNL